MTKDQINNQNSGPIEVKIKEKQGGAIAAQMNVWVVWVNFSSKLTGASAIAGSPLGLHGGRGVGGYKRAAGIDYTGTVEPKTIITEEDRLSIETQQRQAGSVKIRL